MRTEHQPQRVAVTGASGLLGRMLLQRLAARGHTVIAGCHRSRPALPDGVTAVALDLCEPESAAAFVAAARADWIIHAAAMTDVDRCEREPDLAHALNVTATRNLAAAVKSTSTRILYLSTDYVFDGRNGPCDETAAPAPLNVYGQTKLEGEHVVGAAGTTHTVIRSAGFLGIGPPGRPTFAEAMVHRMTEHPPLAAATDQRSNITPVDYLAAAIIEIGEESHTGLWHVAGQEIISRYDFALRLAQCVGLDRAVVRPVKYYDLNRPARRPLDGGLVSKRTLHTQPATLATALKVWQARFTSQSRTGP